MEYKNYRVSQPTIDPNEVYPQVPGIDYNDFKLSSEKMPQEQWERALAQLQAYVETQKSNFLGYQVNQNLDYQQNLAQYLDYSINNVGDPFVSGNFTMNSKFAERAVLDYFASLWNARWPHENSADLSDENWKDSYWGYVLSMGSSEANIFGLWNARDYLAGRALLYDPENEARAKRASLGGKPYAVEPREIYYQAEAPDDDPNRYEPIAFYSQDTHYSIIKTMRVLSIKTFYEAGSGAFECPLKYPDDYPDGFSEQYLDENGWPYEVPSDNDGAIYIPALAKLVEAFAQLGHPIMVNFNFGTTFKGAYDHVEEAVNQLVPILKQYDLYEREVIYDPENNLSDTRTGFWFHVDGALGAAYMPFLEMTEEIEDLPVFDFRIPDIQSICMSGHKWIGAPWPCGIYMSKVKYQLLPPDDPNYIGSPDSTFSGSRNAFSALILWDYLAKHSYEDLKEKIVRAQDLVQYAVEQFNTLEEEMGEDLWVEHAPLALTIRFKQTNSDIIFKYSLSGEVLYVDGEKRAYSHIYIMDSVTKEQIDNLIADLKQPDSFPEQELYPELQQGSAPKDAGKGVYVPQTGRGFR